jgi:hypothetical protein
MHKSPHLMIAVGIPRFATEHDGEHEERDEDHLDREHEAPQGRYAHEGKQSKAEVDYGERTFCGICQHYQPNGPISGHCDIVRGPIRADMGCKLFERAGGEHVIAPKYEGGEE